MRIAIIGSGGREHAICQKIYESKKIKKIFCIPGNGGTSEIANNVAININNFEEIKSFLINKNIDLTIVGPEEPLVNGIVDFLNNEGLKVFGPDKFCSRLEGSKIFTKKICKLKNIPTANFEIFKDKLSSLNYLKETKYPTVVKADGLAAGKGVYICENFEESSNAVMEIFNGKFGIAKQILIEEFLRGDEMSYFVISDGKHFKNFNTAQDHKRVGEGDTGPNTGGMGAYSPARLLTNDLEKKIKKKIIEPTLKAMKNLGYPYEGFLYAGLMINNKEPYLIEYNIRMGDPECQVLMMKLKTDLLKIIDFSTKNNLKNLKIKWDKNKCITIVLCANGYPGKYIKDREIKNLSTIVSDKNNQIFHAGTYEKNNKILSMGGRVLNVTCSAKSLDKAKAQSLSNLKKINWTDGFFRKDIGWRATKK